MMQTYLKKLGTLALIVSGTLLSASEVQAQTACSELFFSEYIEGSTGNNKVLEIYNPTNAAVSLSAYSVKLFANGAATANNTLVLTGTLASGDVLVIVHGQAGAPLLALADIQTSTAAGLNPTNFNGNDAVALYKTVGTNEVLVDLIGNIGCDPGTAWVDGITKSTANRLLRRKASVNTGITTDPAGTTATPPTNTACPFPTLATEWDDFIDTDYSNLGTHTATGCASPPAGPSVGFKTSTTTVAENVAGGTRTVSVRIANPSTTAASSVNVALGTTGTATAGTDFTFTGSTLNWAAGDTTSKTVTVTIIDDAILETDETVVLNLNTPSAGTTLGSSVFTLTIDDNEVKPIPVYTVAQVTTNNPTTFVADSLNKVVSLIGTLYGVNQRTTGLQLTLIDNTGGIGLFRNSITLPAQGWPAAMPVEGDSVQAWGKIGQFNGLTQLELDSIKVLGTHALRKPMVVNGPLGEHTESELITIANPVSLVDPTQWKTTGSFTVEVTDGTNTYDVRIVSTSDIVGTPAPTGIFVLTGIGGQFDNSDPRDSGYQLIPRRLTDIRNVTGIAEELANTISVYPNPVSNVLKLNLSTLAGKNATISVVNTLGQVVAEIPANATELNVANFPAGVYNILISTPNASAVKRFVKIN